MSTARCTCDYAGLAGEPHKVWCEIEGGIHAECATRHHVLEQENAELRAELTAARREHLDAWNVLQPVAMAARAFRSRNGDREMNEVAGDLLDALRKLDES